MSNQFHHHPKKGGNKGILAAKREQKRAEAEARNAAYQRKLKRGEV